MEQIQHVAACPEATKGEIKCSTCRKLHDFKRRHALCNSLMKSPVKLLRRLSNSKRGSNTSAGEPVATKRGKIAVGEDSTGLSRQESHGENVWWPEMEDPSSFPVHEMEDPSSFPAHGIASTSNPALELDAESNINIPFDLGLRDSQAARPLPTPPSTRNHSWSEDSQNLMAYGDAMVAHVPEHPSPYVVPPQTTVDDYERHGSPTDSLRLGIPPVQYIHESTFVESSEGLEIPEADGAPWDDAVFHEAEDPQVNSRLVPTALDANVSDQYNDFPAKSASIFSSSFTASWISNPHRQKKNKWPTTLHRSNAIPRSSFGRQQRQIFDGAPGLSEQDGPASIAGQQDPGAGPSIARQASFDAGAQDSITVSSFEGRDLQTTSRSSEDKHSQTPPRHGADEQQQPRIARLQHDNRHRGHQYEECGLCGQRFWGQPKNRRQHLKRHVESTHGGVRFRCGHQGCARSYKRADNLHDHEAKAHGFVLHQRAGAGGGTEVAELAAGDVEIRQGGGHHRIVSRLAAAAAVAEAEGSASDTGHQAPSAMEAHFGVLGHPIPAEEGQGCWRPAGDDDDTQDPGAMRAASLTEEKWEALIAGVSGGQRRCGGS